MDQPDEGGMIVPVTDTGCLLQEADRLQEQLSVLAATSSPANKAYYEQLCKNAAEAAARGYGIQRMTHTICRTRTRKTTKTTNVCTNETETNTLESTAVDSWLDKGPPSAAGFGLHMARGKRIIDRYSDGTEEIKDCKVQEKQMFWPEGHNSSTHTAAHVHSHMGSSGGVQMLVN
jgi:hypothetical protein